ncbi:MAG TPA: PadR family transcriptional regulator [Ktedonobacterales bacterium]
MYELIILSFLARWPLHGYLIAKIISDIIGPYARLSNGRLYPLLAKLEAEGLIVTAEGGEPQPGGRRQRAYTITAAGRLRFHALMMDTTSNPGDYQRIFWYKVPCLILLDLSERLYLLDHYVTYCQTHIFHLTAEIDDLRQHFGQYHPGAPAYRSATLYAVEHALRQWRLELDDAMQWRTQVVADAEQSVAQAETQAGDSVTASASREENPDVSTTHTLKGR